MADVLKTEGLVIAATNLNNQIYPFACAKNSTITISREAIELAGKTNGYYREFIQGKSSFTVSGTGLVKMTENNMQGANFFNEFILAGDTTFWCFLDMIDNQNNYKVYKFKVLVSELTLDATYGSPPNYSFTLQGASAIELINISAQAVVSGGKVTAQNSSTYRLVAVGYGGKWYFNYAVVNEGGGVYTITLGASLNGTTVTTAYIAI
jgi:hypothetical protein